MQVGGATRGVLAHEAEFDVLRRRMQLFDIEHTSPAPPGDMDVSCASAMR